MVLIFFCLFEGLAFRGNKNENIGNVDFNKEKSYYKSNNEGNFIGFLKLIAGFNPIIAAHINECKEKSEQASRAGGRGSYVSFLSSIFVSKALYIIRTHIVSKIIREVKESGGSFGLECDASQDVSTKDQFSIVLRYINSKCEILERTVAFVENKDSTGYGLYKLIEETLKKLNLNLKEVVGFSFDGAQNMRSDKKGVNHFLKKYNSDAIYTWCYSHKFSLAISAACKSNLAIKYIIGMAEETGTFFKGSYKRMNFWTNCIQYLQGVSSLTKLKLVGLTRWSSKKEAIHNIVKTDVHLFAVIKTFHAVCNEDSFEPCTLIKAKGILDFWYKKENIVLVYLTDKVFCLLDGVTKQLQTQGLDVLSAYKAIEMVHANLQKLAGEYDMLLEQAKLFADNVYVLIKNDKKINTVGRFFEKTNNFLDDTQIKTAFNSFIEDLLTQMETSFMDKGDKIETVYTEMSFLDPRSFKNRVADKVSFKQLCAINKIPSEQSVLQQFHKFAVEYEKHQESTERMLFLTGLQRDDTDEDSLISCIELCDSDIEEYEEILLKNVDNIRCNCLECVMKYIKERSSHIEVYKDLYKIYKFVSMLPCTQVKCERDFSKMKIVKNRLRSNLVEENLQSLMIIQAEADMFADIDLEDLVDEIALSSRELSLLLL